MLIIKHLGNLSLKKHFFLIGIELQEKDVQKD